jgi:hypothetical protein
MLLATTSTATAQSGYVTQVNSGTPATTVAAPSSLAAPAKSGTLTNSDIVQLVKVGLGDEAIVAKIQTSPHAFDLSTDGLIALKGAGVSNKIIAAMLGGPAVAASPAGELSMDSADPRVPHYPGLYMVDATGAKGKMTRVNPTVSNQAKTGGIFGYALTMGIATMSIKAAIPGASASVQTQSGRPVFYAYFEESIPRDLRSGGASQWSNGIGTVTSSPAEVNLVRFVEKKGRREAQVGSMNIAGAKTGVMDKDQLAFDSEMIGPGIFRVQPRDALPPGEYGFIQSISGSNQGGAMTARVFDFGVM